MRIRMQGFLAQNFVIKMAFPPVGYTKTAILDCIPLKHV